MNRERLIQAVIILLIATCLVLLAWDRGGTGNVDEREHGFQMASSGTPWVYVLDTTTGDLWAVAQHPNSAEWRHMGKPSQQEKKWVYSFKDE